MNHEKLSPALAQALADYQRGGKPALAGHQPGLGLVAAEGQARQPARVVAFLHVDPATPRKAFASLGVEMNGDDGPVRTGIVPLDALDALTDHAAVHRVVAAQRLQPCMDVAGPAVGIPDLQATGLSGKGVIVGVVDSGIDGTNPAFPKRVLRIWDQTVTGAGVAEGAYGVELKGKAMQQSPDTEGHGTQMAGIAAGEDPTYTGVAPAAQIVAVKSDLLTAHIADGVRYIFRVAAELKRPAVVILGVSGHGDAHDGTDSLSAVIDAAVGPGRIVCCAAGNDGHDNVHAQVKLKKGGTALVAASLTGPAATFNGWYAGSDRMAVAVVTPAGTQTPFQPVAAAGATATQRYDTPSGVVLVTTPGPDPGNGDVNFTVQIQPKPTPAGTAKPQAWKLRIQAVTAVKGVIDLWSVDGAAAQFTGAAVRGDTKIGTPGCASKAVTVGAYVTKAEWADMLGGDHTSGETDNTMASFSSPGPRRDGGKKPDLVAPGSVLASALSVKSPSMLDVLADDWNRLDASTSLAAAFIGGVVALLLERDKTLDPDKVKALLKQHSAIPGKPAGTWDATWGYGLIDATSL